VVIVFLLLIIVAILLFGAGAIRGWLRGAALLIFGGAIAVAVLVFLASWLGEGGAMIALVIGALAFAALGIWASPKNEAEREHKQRIMRAQEQRRKRREEGKNW